MKGKSADARDNALLSIRGKNGLMALGTFSQEFLLVEGMANPAITFTNDLIELIHRDPPYDADNNKGIAHLMQLSLNDLQQIR
jgi:hypothetical protein